MVFSKRVFVDPPPIFLSPVKVLHHRTLPLVCLLCPDALLPFLNSSFLLPDSLSLFWFHALTSISIHTCKHCKLRSKCKSPSESELPSLILCFPDLPMFLQISLFHFLYSWVTSHCVYTSHFFQKSGKHLSKRKEKYLKKCITDVCSLPKEACFASCQTFSKKIFFTRQPSIMGQTA